jgi:3-oxoadipate enol-lactonase
MPTINIDGSDLHYIEHGSGEIPVIFGHGLMLSSKMWQSFYFPSLPSKCHGYALDMRGHGRSAEVTGCTVRNMADDVYTFAQKLSLEKFVYVGVSMGGGIGLQLALNHPGCISALILLSPLTGLGTSGLFLFRILGSFFAQKRWLIKPMLRSMCARKPPKDSLDGAVDEAMLVTADRLKEFIMDKKPIDRLEKLDSLNIPTLCVIGEKDTAVPAGQQKELAKRIPGAKTIAYPGYGHMVTYEKQEDIFNEMMRFIDSVLPSESADC